MKYGISVSGESGEKLAAYAREKGIAVSILPADTHSADALSSEGRLESGAEILHPGGSISCGDARLLAGNLGITGRELGQLLDFLKIKIRDCELGCF